MRSNGFLTISDRKDLFVRYPLRVQSRNDLCAAGLREYNVSSRYIMYRAAAPLVCRSRLYCDSDTAGVVEKIVE